VGAGGTPSARGRVAHGLMALWRVLSEALPSSITRLKYLGEGGVRGVFGARGAVQRVNVCGCWAEIGLCVWVTKTEGEDLIGCGRVYACVQVHACTWAVVSGEGQRVNADVKGG
jgi:hypothetical protein